MNNQCVIENCASLNDYGCFACECGFFVNADKSCSKITDGCLTYQRGVCKNCLPHYKLKGGSCTIEGCITYTDEKACGECKPEYDLVGGECHFKNCHDWSEDQCLSCKDKFNLVGGKCLAAS